MKKVFFVLTAAAVIFSSCAVTNPNVNYTYPNNGVFSNVDIVSKDFETVGIVFVNSTEVIDTQGNHTGSKITYEMFMREAANLEADDVVNIKIDINEKIERKTINGLMTTITTYNYYGTGLAIKYTSVIQQDSESATATSAGKSNTKIDISNAIKTAAPAPAAKKSRAGIILLLTGLGLAGVGVATYFVMSSNHSF